MSIASLVDGFNTSKKHLSIESIIPFLGMKGGYTQTSPLNKLDILTHDFIKSSHVYGFVIGCEKTNQIDVPKAPHQVVMYGLRSKQIFPHCTGSMNEPSHDVHLQGTTKSPEIWPWNAIRQTHSKRCGVSPAALSARSCGRNATS